VGPAGVSPADYDFPPGRMPGIPTDMMSVLRRAPLTAFTAQVTING